MTTRITLLGPVNGGIAYGLMTPAGSPYTVVDALANDLVNRGVALYTDPQVPGSVYGQFVTYLTNAQFGQLLVGTAGVTYEITDVAGRPQYRWNGSAFAAIGSGGGGSFTNPVFSGIVTSPGADLVVGTPVVGNALDFTKGKNTLTLSVNTTLTFSGSPSTDQYTQLYLTGGAATYTITWPANVRSIGKQAVVATTVVPANWSGPIFLVKTAAGYDMGGEPIALANKGIAGRFASGANDTQVICEYMPYAGTIVGFVTQCASGTATYQLTIGGVNVTGGANAVSTTLVNNVPSAANVIAAGSLIAIVRTVDATCVNADWTVLIAPVTA